MNNMLNPSPAIQRHVFALLVSDEPGILARVVGLFSGRGYNIESLSVASIDPVKKVARITVIASGTPMILEQIEAQLHRLIPVYKVINLTRQGDVLEKEMALIKVVCEGEKRQEALRIAETMKIHAADATPNSFIFEIVGSAEEINRFVAVMLPLGETEVVRGGSIGIARGADIL